MSTATYAENDLWSRGKLKTDRLTLGP